MNRLLCLVLIACLLIVLCLTCSTCIVQENMTSGEAASIAAEYTTNLQSGIDQVKKEMDDATIALKETQDKLKIKETELLQKQYNLKTQTVENAEPALILKTKNDIQLLTNEKMVLDNLVLTYTQRIDGLNKHIDDKTQTMETYKKQADAYKAMPQAPPQPSPMDIPANPIQDGNNITEINDTGSNAYVQGPDNTMIALEPTGDLGGSATYYEPGTYKFGASTYVPSYEDSVYLSKTTGQSSVANYLDQASLVKGACDYYKDQPNELEKACLKVDKNNCSSMSCCVLLGGSKCVSGNENGPHNHLNYGDISVKNKDFYYYGGKCYGNCK